MRRQISRGIDPTKCLLYTRRTHLPKRPKHETHEWQKKQVIFQCGDATRKAKHEWRNTFTQRFLLYNILCRNRKMAGMAGNGDEFGVAVEDDREFFHLLVFLDIHQATSLVAQPFSW